MVVERTPAVEPRFGFVRRAAEDADFSEERSFVEQADEVQREERGMVDPVDNDVTHGVDLAAEGGGQVGTGEPLMTAREGQWKLEGLRSRRRGRLGDDEQQQEQQRRDGREE